jgi:hypothetical protein
LSDISSKYRSKEYPGYQLEKGGKSLQLILPKRGTVFTFFLLYVLCQPALSQDSLLYQKISIGDSILPVHEVFRIVSNHTHLNFTYNPDIIDISKSVHIPAGNETLLAVLNETLQDPTLEFRIIGHQIVIFRPVIIKRSDPSLTGSKNTLTFLEIKGRVLDVQNRQPVPFASIFLGDYNIGTVANLQGDFLLKIDSRYLNDTFGISCMGYQRLLLPVINSISQTRIYYLKPDIIPIQEVIIRKTNPLTLLRNAIEKIPGNYPVHPELMTSFYREIIRKSNQVMAVSEAILQTYKGSYTSGFENDQIKIIKGRKTEDKRNSDTLILKLKAGLNTTMLLDVVKHPPDFLSPENFNAYTYKMTDIIVNDDNELYVIEFTPRETYPEAFYRGRIFLDMKSLAITDVEFEIDPARMDEAAGMFVLKKPRNIRVKPQQAQYKVTFSKIGDRYYLKLIRCETSFRIRQKNQLFGLVYSTSLEMAVTRVETNDVERFRIKETARSQEIFMEQITDYQDSFWEEYNFIKPEVPLEEAVKKLNRD